MKLVVITSGAPGEGKTTLAVNLACGLARRGHPSVIVDIGRDSAARGWVGRTDLPPGLTLARWEELRGLGDKVEFGVVDFELGHPAVPQVLARADVVMLAVDLSGTLPDIVELFRLEKTVKEIRGKGAGFDLVIPNRVNPREWSENENRLMVLAEVWGEDRIADPVPG